MSLIVVVAFLLPLPQAPVVKGPTRPARPSRSHGFLAQHGADRANDPTARTGVPLLSRTLGLAIGLFEKTRPGSRAWALERKTLEKATTNVNRATTR